MPVSPHPFKFVLTLLKVDSTGGSMHRFPKRLRRKLVQLGIVLSNVEMMNELREINEFALLYPAPQRSEQPVVQTQLSRMNEREKKLASVLGLERFLRN
jgi:hypothetical protein